METIAFLSSMMFLAVFVVLFWFDRTKRNDAAIPGDDKRDAPNAAD
jgi:hypothetical protein